MKESEAEIRSSTQMFRILVCLSGSPSNRKVIQSAARFAQGSSRTITALYVDQGNDAKEDPALQGNMELARSLGARVEIVTHRDVIGAIIQYAKKINATDLFIGYSGPSRISFPRPAASYRLIHSLHNVDVHIIPDATVQLKASGLETNERNRLNAKDFLTTGLIMAAATALSVLFYHSRYSNSNIITIYILAVLISAVMTAERIYGIIAAALYILLFNFLFIEPRFSFMVYDPDYMVTYLVSVIAAIITGNISSKMKQVSMQERVNAYQAQTLLNASELLQRAENNLEIVQITTGQLRELMRREIFFFPVPSSGRTVSVRADSGDASSEYTGSGYAASKYSSPENTVSAHPSPGNVNAENQNIESIPNAGRGSEGKGSAGVYPGNGVFISASSDPAVNGRGLSAWVPIRDFQDESTSDDKITAVMSDPDSPDRKAIAWTLQHNQRTGWGTGYYPDAAFQYLSVRTGSSIYGIIAVEGKGQALSQFEENILLSLISECALSLESEKNRREREAAQIVAENERFRSKLLRSISHDLRTPLTSISGNAGNLLEHAEEFEPDVRNKIYEDIYSDSVWLIDLVENLLAITKLEEKVGIQPVAEVVADVLETAVENARRHKCDHQIVLETDEQCLIAMMDVPLILQVVSNLISNAFKYTPEGSMIRIRDWRAGDQVIVSVSDNGPGISDEEKKKVFDLFYTGKKKEPDSSRSLGLGLNLCRSILEAHGQSIWVEDAHPHGTVFLFTLALAKGAEHESVSDSDR